MASDVDICNAALSKLGLDSITSLLEDSDAARAANAMFSIVRDDLLSLHPWNFATVWKTLAKLSTAPDNDEYDSQYELPTNTLRVVSLRPIGWSWVVEGRALLTNASSPRAQIITRITDTTLFSPGFTFTLTLRLAYELCVPLSARRGNAQDHKAAYEEKLKEAQGSDGQEGSPVLEDSNPLADARGGSCVICGNPQF